MSLFGSGFPELFGHAVFASPCDTWLFSTACLWQGCDSPARCSVWGLPHSSSGHHRSPGEQASSCAKAFSVFSHLGIGTKLAVVGEEGEHGGSRDWRGSFS